MDNRAKDRLFGQEVIQRGWVTPSDVLQALNIQVRLRQTFQRQLCLGEILYIRGLVNEQQLLQAVRNLTNPEPGSEALDAPAAVALLGEILVELGYASHEQILASLDAQASLRRTTGAKRLIGEILLERGTITSAQLHEALALSKQRRHG